MSDEITVTPDAAAELAALPRPTERAASICRDRALRILNVTPAQLKSAPQITPQLRAIAHVIRGAGIPRATRRQQQQPSAVWTEPAPRAPYGPGGDLQRTWPIYLSHVDDERCQAVVAAYHRLPAYLLPHVPIEAFCLAANVPPIYVLEQLTLALMRAGAQASSIIASVNAPRVVQKTIEMALTDGGDRDRAMLHRATGFLPSPKGSQTNITVTQTAQAAASAHAAAMAPPPEATIRRLSDRFNEAPRPATVEVPAVTVVEAASDASADFDIDDEADDE